MDKWVQILDQNKPCGNREWDHIAPSGISLRNVCPPPSSWWRELWKNDPEQDTSGFQEHCNAHFRLMKRLHFRCVNKFSGNAEKIPLNFAAETDRPYKQIPSSPQLIPCRSLDIVFQQELHHINDTISGEFNPRISFVLTSKQLPAALHRHFWRQKRSSKRWCRMPPSLSHRPVVWEWCWVFCANHRCLPHAVGPHRWHGWWIPLASNAGVLS